MFDWMRPGMGFNNPMGDSSDQNGALERLLNAMR